MSQEVRISAINGTKLYGDLYYKESEQLQPLIVFVHGFKGFKNWGGFPYMLEQLSKSGYNGACFNFSHNGVSNERPEEFVRLYLFAKNTFSKELDELGYIIDYFYEKADNFNIDRKRIALIGHSRGGGISIIKASSDSRIKCLVTLASVSHFDRYSDKLKNEWRSKGYIEVENSRTKQMMRMDVTLLEDIEKNTDTLNICSAVSKLKIPALFIHGKEDLAVRCSEAEEIYESSNKELTELFLLENTGHTFGVTHPFSGTTDAFERVIGRMKSFLNVHL